MVPVDGLTPLRFVELACGSVRTDYLSRSAVRMRKLEALRQ
jgi:hypothetical protein